MDTNKKKVKFKKEITSPNYTPKVKTIYKKLLEQLFSTEYLKALEDNSNFRIIKTVGIYRYISLLVTSIMFLFISLSLSFQQKLTIILFLAVEAQVIIFMYTKHASDLKKIKGIIVLETLINVVLLYLTGNLASPFVWYCLNPIISSAVFYKDKFCWENLGIYFISLLVSSTIYYDNKFDNNFISYYWTTSCIFFLVVFGLRQIIKYTEEIYKQSELLKLKNKELTELSNKLDMSNKAMSESTGHIMTLYQSVEALTVQENVVDLIKIFAQYAAKLTKNEKTFFWYINEAGKYHIEVNNEEITKNKKDLLGARLHEEVQNLENFQGKTSIKVLNDQYLLYEIASDSKLHGVLGIKVSDGTEKYRRYEKQLSYLKDLSIIAIQRLEFKKLSERFIVTGEQNRIANELHDSVSQQLFGIVCSTHALLKKYDNLEPESIEEQLASIKETANTALTEIRSTVYHLSSKKRKEESFYCELKNYLEQLGRLHTIETSFNYSGDEHNMTSALKLTLYRIICEASGNAVRHGQASNLTVNLSLESESIALTIKDNGTGFELGNLNIEKGMGLGIYNMRNLIKKYNGSFSIESEINKGTSIAVNIPIVGFEDCKKELA